MTATLIALSKEAMTSREYHPQHAPEVAEARERVERMADRLNTLREQARPVIDAAAEAGRIADEVETLVALGEAEKRDAVAARKEADKQAKQADNLAKDVRIAESALDVSRQRVDEALSIARERLSAEIRGKMREQFRVTQEAVQKARKEAERLYAWGEVGRGSGVGPGGAHLTFMPLLDGTADRWVAENRGVAK